MTKWFCIFTWFQRLFPFVGIHHYVYFLNFYCRNSSVNIKLHVLSVFLLFKFRTNILSMFMEIHLHFSSQWKIESHYYHFFYFHNVFYFFIKKIMSASATLTLCDFCFTVTGGTNNVGLKSNAFIRAKQKPKEKVTPKTEKCLGLSPWWIMGLQIIWQ